MLSQLKHGDNTMVQGNYLLVCTILCLYNIMFLILGVIMRLIFDNFFFIYLLLKARRVHANRFPVELINLKTLLMRGVNIFSVNKSDFIQCILIMLNLTFTGNKDL